MNKNLTLGLCGLALVLAACAPSTASIGTAIAQTQAVAMTATHPPESTVGPTVAVATPTSLYSDELKLRIRDFLTKASRVAAMSTDGVTYAELHSGVGDAAGSYSLVETTWPVSADQAAVKNAKLSLQGWKLASDLWYLKLNGTAENGNGQVTDGKWPAIDYPDYPPGPKNNYEAFMDYAGDDLVKLKAPAGNTYLPFDPNISILLTKGNGYFSSAQAQLLIFLQ